jgi:hypothetical protein
MILTWPAVHLLVRLLCASAAGVAAFSTAARAQELFKSPDEAATALVAAARDDNFPRFRKILGIAGREILFSGDEVQDASDRQRFLAAYDNRHSISEKDATATLLVGQDDFPFPIPIVRSDNGWKFDVEMGRKEIVARRIGRNELDAVQTSLAFFDAQQEYATKNLGSQGAGVYAQRIVSRPGAKDGLYWPTEPGQEQSPLGELAARAASQGYTVDEGRQPFHGYYFKILTRQGSAAPGGKIDYLARGKMIGGFALLAYPAEYARSGLTSFLISHAGTVYQKDLGRDTRYIADRMLSFNPGDGWEKVTPEKP